MKKTKNLPAPVDEKYDENAFSDSISAAFKQKNEKRYFFAILAAVGVIVLLIVGALADILSVCFDINRWFGYAMSGLLGLLLILFIIRPTVKILGARFFITDVTAENFNAARKKNYRALRSVAGALVEYNTDPKNRQFRYLTDEKCQKINAGLKGEKEELKTALKEAYADEVGPFANKIILKSAGKVFLTTSISQNDKIDALSVLLVNLSLVKKIVGIYGYRPSFAKLFRIYFSVLRSALLAYGMQNVNWFNVFSKFFTGVAKKLPFIDTIVDSATQGTVSAFMTLLVGYKTKRYLCSDYKKQEKLDAAATGLPAGAEEATACTLSLTRAT